MFMLSHNQRIRVYHTYRHFKGSIVMPTGYAIDSKTGEAVVVYVHLKDEITYTRPVKEWFDTEDEKGSIREREENCTGQITRFEEVVFE